jgi:hypothetical protein
VAAQIEGWVEGEAVKVTLGMKELRKKFMGWLRVAWEDLCKETEMIMKGWGKCRMGEIHDLAFQSRALSVCLNRGLLAREQLEVDLGAGPEGDAEIIEQHEGAATMLQVWQSVWRSMMSLRTWFRRSGRLIGMRS